MNVVPRCPLTDARFVLLVVTFTLTITLCFSLQARSVALTIESGSFVKFQYNLGTGPIDIINWAVRVQPGHWYTAYATRLVINPVTYLKQSVKS